MNGGWRGSKRHQISWRTVVFVFFFFGVVCGLPQNRRGHRFLGTFQLIMVFMVFNRVRQSWCYVSLKQSGSAPSDPKMICYDDTTFLSHDPAASVWMISRLCGWRIHRKDDRLVKKVRREARSPFLRSISFRGSSCRIGSNTSPQIKFLKVLQHVAFAVIREEEM